VSNVGDIDGIWDDLYHASLPYGRKGIAVMALSGVDLALWDLLGKAENQRVCELLRGDRRESVRAYATGPDVPWYRDLGFDAYKITALTEGKAAPEATVVRMGRSIAACHRRRWPPNDRFVHDLGRGPHRTDGNKSGTVSDPLVRECADAG